MNITQIESNIQSLIVNFNEESFIYDFLIAFGTPNATIKKLQIGSLNLSKKEDEVLWKKKLYFTRIASNSLHSFIDSVRKDETINKQQPRFIIVINDKSLVAYDTKTEDSLDCELQDLPKHFSFFLPLAGMEKAQHQVENPADVRASERMAKLYDEIRKDNQFDTDEEVHGLNVFLSRLLFCFFAEDTGIFETSQFTHSISNHTQTDGSDLDTYLDRVFEIMNIPKEIRASIPQFLNDFPYVNGGLFKDFHKAPKFTRRSRQVILECGELSWSEINPDIFGSMIQAVITPEHRGGMGMHYTSVPNIMKVIEPLFLNELYEAFDDSKGNIKKLNELLKRLWNIKIFDPACGSGNFLIISYKELRKLEMLIFQEIDKVTGTYTNQFTGITLNNFFGIELDDFAHEVAILSLWLAEHQMNVEFTKQFGRSQPSLPLKQTGNIVQGNACRIDWEMVCPKNENDEIYILGNPPYLGFLLQSKNQKDDMALVFKELKNYSKLDFIACWFFLASKYIRNHNVEFAFVSTNSICQGEQVSLLWQFILDENMEIHFAHTSFKWVNNAKHNAGVTVIIVGVRNKKKSNKYIISDNRKYLVENINPYLANGKNIFVDKKSKSISTLPLMSLGSSPYENGQLLLSKEEKVKLLTEYPLSHKFIKYFVGSVEFLRGIEKYCLWIKDEDIELAYNIPPIKERLDKIRIFRSKSGRGKTFETASTPNQFTENRHQNKKSLIVPIVCSERREYLVCGFLDEHCIIPNSARMIYEPETYIFSLISSRIHITWARTVAGRLKTDLRYSGSLTYNTFPFPQINSSQKQELENCVFKILEEREKHSEKTLAQLYDPDKMPEGLREAHRQNDLAVERCYRLKPFESDEERLEYLFKLYEQMIAKEKEQGTLFESTKKKRK
jgi:hypothetical protein